MKKTLFLLSLLSLTALGYSQITLESGANLIVSSGSTVIANDGIVNNGGAIDNAGTIEIKGNLENNTTALTASTSTGTIKFNGTVAQELTGDADATFYGTVEIDNTNGVSITNTATGSNQTVKGRLAFTNGLLTLNTFNLTLDSAAITPGTGKYAQTNSTGVVTRNVPADGATDVVYPVGNTAYNPLTLQNSTTATADNYSVRVVDAEPAGASTSHMVDRSWEITEAISGGSDLTVTPQWNSAEELTGFDGTNSSIGLTTDGGTTYNWGETAAAAGADPYTNSGTGFSGVGTFAVGDYFYSGKRLNLNLWLAGAFNGTNMNQDLFTAGLIPTTDPYGISTETTTVPTNAVDWVKVVLRDQTTPATKIDSFAFFVDIDGNLLDRDGNIGGKITGVSNTTPYYVAVMHRNHMGVMSSATVDLSVASPSWNYTTAQAQAWQDGLITTNAAMKEVATGIFGLWEGDANDDGFVKYNGTSNDKNEILGIVGLTTPNAIISGYSSGDIDMNGEVKYNGTGNDKNKVLAVVGLSTPNNIYTRHLP